MLKAEPAGAFHQPRLAGSFSGSPGSWTWIRDSRLAQTSRRRPLTIQGTQCHAMTCCAVLCSAPPCDAMLCVAMLCDAMLHYALPCSSTPCYAVLYHASRTLSGSLPCSTSDCANREEIYAMVRDGREGWDVTYDAGAPSLPFSSLLLLLPLAELRPWIL